MPTPAYIAIGEIMRSPGVRRVLDGVADRIAARAVAITARDHLGPTDVVTRFSGTRPKGRPYSQVGIVQRTGPQARAALSQANGYSEFGTATTPRSRLAGQSISGARNPNP